MFNRKGCAGSITVKGRASDAQAIARRLDQLADLPLNEGDKTQAERLSARALEIREAAR